MKVALIGLRLSVGNRLMVDTIGRALCQLGIEVVFLGDEGYEPPTGIPSLPVSNGTSYFSIFRDSFRFQLYRSATHALTQARPDICYFVSVHPANGPLAWSIRRSVRNCDGQPPVIAMHLHDPLPHPGFASLVIFATQELQIRAADRVVVYGEALGRQVRRYYGFPKDRIMTIRHGAYRPSREMPPVASNGYRWFSFLGRIAPYKGLDIFLAAAREVHGQDPACRFYVGGAGDIAPYQPDLEALGSSVVVENRELSNAETDDVMRASWAVVLPYTSATQSGVIPVAYWNATPVIATQVGSLGEVVRDGETGFIVERRDVNAVAERMRRLAGNQGLRRQLGGGAFSFYDRWLRWERIAHDLIKAITQ